MADIGVFSRYKGFNDFQEEAKKASLANALVQAKLSGSGGSLPAPLQLANEFQKARAAGDIQRMDDIAQFAKIYDKGILPPADVPAAPAPIVPQSAPKLTPMTSPQAADAVLDLYGTGNDTGANGAPAPAMRPTLANAPAARTIKGYAGAAASISAAKKGAEKQAEKDVELGMNPLIKSAEDRAAYKEKGFQKLPQAQRILQSKEFSEGSLDSKINSIATRANGFTTGFGGALLGAVPGSAAYDLRSDVDTLLANAGFDRLQEMRDNSPTGGALGNVTEIELKLLQSTAQALYASQSKEQFLNNLAAFQKQRAVSLENIRAAYEQDYQRFGGEQDVALPAPSGRPATPAAARDQFNASKAPKARLKYNPATGDFE